MRFLDSQLLFLNWNFAANLNFIYIMKRLFVLKSITFLMLFVVLVGCGNKHQNEGYQQGPPELPVAVVKESDAVVTKTYAASVEGVSNVEIRPQVSGYLTKIHVDEGQFVKAGQVLFSIESQVYREQLNNAQAALLSAKSNLDNSKINLDRKKELVSNKMVSDFQVREAEIAYNAAKAGVDQASAVVESAKINLAFTQIKAPVSGYTSRFNYRLGSLLSPTNQQPLTILSDIQQVYTYFSLSENDFINFQRQYAGSTIAEKIKNTPPVTLLMADGTPYAHTGKIDAVEGLFNKTTGAITVRAKFVNPEVLLRSGNTGKIVMEQQLKNALLFPIASSVVIQDKVFIYSLDKESKVVQIPVEVSGKSGNNFIVSGGLKAGDRYIVMGFERLQPGTPVIAAKDSALVTK